MLRSSLVLDAQETPGGRLVFDVPGAILVSLNSLVKLVNFEVREAFAILTSLKIPGSWMVLSSSHVTTLNVMRRL